MRNTEFVLNLCQVIIHRSHAPWTTLTCQFHLTISKCTCKPISMICRRETSEILTLHWHRWSTGGSARADTVMVNSQPGSNIRKITTGGRTWPLSQCCPLTSKSTMGTISSILVRRPCAAELLWNATASSLSSVISMNQGLQSGIDFNEAYGDKRKVCPWGLALNIK